MLTKLLLSNSLDARISEITRILDQFEIIKNHPDLLYFEADSKLGVVEAKEIIKHFTLKPFSAKGRVVVLENASALTTDAQNALLKTLEEPPEAGLLILGATSENDLLPTVLSRCEITSLNVIPAPAKGWSASGGKAGIQKTESAWIPDEVGDDELNKDVERLINSNLEVRFEYVEKLKDKKEFLHSLLVYFRAELHAPGQRLASVESAKFLKELLQAEQWINQNVNQRAILEYLMQVMPVSI